MIFFISWTVTVIATFSTITVQKSTTIGYRKGVMSSVLVRQNDQKQHKV